MKEQMDLMRAAAPPPKPKTTLPVATASAPQATSAQHRSNASAQAGPLRSSQHSSARPSPPFGPSHHAQHLRPSTQPAADRAHASWAIKPAPAVSCVRYSLTWFHEHQHQGCLDYQRCFLVPRTHAPVGRSTLKQGVGCFRQPSGWRKHGSLF